MKLNQWNYINPAAEKETDTQQQTKTLPVTFTFELKERKMYI